MAANRPESPVVDVVIVGGGPVGLTARALLDRWGVSTLLVEKYAELSPFPRSRLINVRSMEIFRQLGLGAKIAATAFAPEFGRIRFRDTLHDSDFATAAMVGINAPIPESPVIGAVSSQDRLEPTLLAAADAPMRFGVELVALSEEAESVVVSLVDRRSGAETRVRARYVLAADGANSTVRQLLGITTTGPGALGRLTTVVFDADLKRWSAGQPAGVYATAYGSFTPLYPEGGWAWIGPTPDDPAHTDWADLVARALGPGSEVEPEVVRVQQWVVTAFVADHFRHSRVLLAGDAAHTIPPAGGLGMNAGVADVHNLCWKLAGVLHGWAGPGLLDSYETERRPVAHRTLGQAVANSQLMTQALGRRREQLHNGQAAHAEIELPWSERYFAQLGLVLGVSYRSDAVIAAAEPSDNGTEYVPTARPGHRMPHVWLADDRSTLDAVGEWFTLFTPHRERRAVAPWPVHIETLPTTDLTHGALLVRPDGHIAAHWPEGLPSVSVLQQALSTITGCRSGG